MIEDGNFRCNHCGELIPDTMLWIETMGTYKVDGSYITFRWDFCDLYCQKAHLDAKDFTKIEEAKHKVKKRKKKK